MKGEIALCMGYFDSVHAGHRALLRECRQYAEAHDMTSAVYTFRDDNGFFDSLYAFEDRKNLLAEAGAQKIISDVFGEELKNLSGKEFLDGLTSKYDIAAFFCGYDYTFGRNAECNAQYLAYYATHNKTFCSIMPCFKADGKKVSTSLIKELLLGGEVEKANELLVKPYFIHGKVVHGRGVGNTFGIPTANIEYSGFLPRAGVYAASATEGDARYSAVVNIGDKPTFGDNSVTIEAMLIGFDGVLYGKELKLEFKKYLRPISKFASANELVEQIHRDIKETLC